MPAAAFTSVLVAAVVPVLPAPPGWHVTTAPARPPCAAAALAATVPVGDAPPCALPRRTVAALPRDGIVVQVSVYGRQRWRTYPRRTLPLRLADAPLRHCYEGIPCRHALQGLAARVRSWNVWVFVVYGRSAPTRRDRARAAAQVARLLLQPNRWVRPERASARAGPPSRHGA